MSEPDGRFPKSGKQRSCFPWNFQRCFGRTAHLQITEEMKLAAAEAIAALVSDEELNENNIMPEALIHVLQKL